MQQRYRDKQGEQRDTVGTGSKYPYGTLVQRHLIFLSIPVVEWSHLFMPALPAHSRLSLPDDSVLPTVNNVLPACSLVCQKSSHSVLPTCPCVPPVHTCNAHYINCTAHCTAHLLTLVQRDQPHHTVVPGGGKHHQVCAPGSSCHSGVNRGHIQCTQRVVLR